MGFQHTKFHQRRRDEVGIKIHNGTKKIVKCNWCYLKIAEELKFDFGFDKETLEDFYKGELEEAKEKEHKF